MDLCRLSAGVLAAVAVAFASVSVPAERALDESVTPPAVVPPTPPEERQPGGGTACPAEMVRVRSFCVDRWEASMVDHGTGTLLSPYYPPDPRLLRKVHALWEIERRLVGGEDARRMPLPEVPALQREGDFEPRAISRPDAVPQAYVSYHVARRACKNAGKRLCTREEWMTACRGSRRTKFPYGDTFDRDRCNVYGYIHPAYVLHGSSSIGHSDPRLNLLAIGGERPLLRLTGETKTCASEWGDDRVYDMVGNLDEWVDDEDGRFVGGFYARSTTKGCESQVRNHSVLYFDYSTGVRCCKTP